MTAIDPELDANLKSDFRAMFRDGIVGSDGELDAWVIHDTSDFVADPRARQAMSMVTDGAIVKACQTYRVDADGIARATDDIERIEPY